MVVEGSSGEVKPKQSKKMLRIIHGYHNKQQKSMTNTNPSSWTTSVSIATQTSDNNQVVMFMNKQKQNISYPSLSLNYI